MSGLRFGTTMLLSLLVTHCYIEHGKKNLLKYVHCEDNQSVWIFWKKVTELIIIIILIFSLQGDVNRDGYLDYGEFIAISIHLRKMGNDNHLKKAFEFFDKDQSGYIEIEELRDELADELETNGEEVITAIMHDVDTDKVRLVFILFLFEACYSDVHIANIFSSKKHDVHTSI